MTERNLRKFTRIKAPFHHTYMIEGPVFAWWEYYRETERTADELSPKLFNGLKTGFQMGSSKDCPTVQLAFADLIQALRTSDALP